MNTIDLHAHTTASDGSLTPSELVALAAKEGLTALGVTDHDTIGGLAEAREAARRSSVELVPGIELAVAYPRGHFHMLGYLIDPESRELRDRLLRLHENRASRNEHMIRKLQDLGLPITLEEVRAASGGGQVGRPHMARVLIEKGIVSSTHEAFERYIGDRAPGYLPKEKLSVEQGIELIHAAGGLAVIAHPLTLGLDEIELSGELSRLRGLGLDGLECYYSLFTTEQTEMLLRLAREAGLLPTGGSDFHGGPKPDIRLGAVIEGHPAPAELLQALKRRRAERAA